MSNQMKKCLVCVSGFAAGIAAGARADIVVGAGGGSLVQSHSPVNQPWTIQAYDKGFQGGVRVANSDISRDGVADVIVGAGPGAIGGHVKVFDGVTGAEVRSFLAFQGFAGGVHVAAGDVNGDGVPDILTGAGAGAPGGHVKVFSGTSGAELMSFNAYGDTFMGGARVAGGDLDGDGFDDIVVGTGFNGHVKAFSGASGALIRSFDAYSPTFTGGVYVAAGDIDGDGFADIITGTGGDRESDTDSLVRVFSGRTGGMVGSFLAFGENFRGGVRVAAGDLDGDGRAEIITGAGPGGTPHVKVFDGAGRTLNELYPFDPSFTGGVFVGAVPSPGAILSVMGLVVAGARRRRGNAETVEVPKG